MGYRLTLGPWTFYPPAPTWQEFFVSEGIPHQTEKEIEKTCSSHLIEPGDFDKPVTRRYWEDWFEWTGGRCARAYQLLEKIDLGPECESGRGRGPLLEFGRVVAAAVPTRKDVIYFNLSLVRWDATQLTTKSRPLQKIDTNSSRDVTQSEPAVST